MRKGGEKNKLNKEGKDDEEAEAKVQRKQNEKGMKMEETGKREGG